MSPLYLFLAVLFGVLGIFGLVLWYPYRKLGHFRVIWGPYYRGKE